jgi:hypothetical protein
MAKSENIIEAEKLLIEYCNEGIHIINNDLFPVISTELVKLKSAMISYLLNKENEN